MSISSSMSLKPFFYQMTEEPLDAYHLMALFDKHIKHSGAVGYFLGRVRREGHHKTTIKSLFIDAYTSMAQKFLHILVIKAQQQYPSVEAICLIHRVGMIPVGETIVLICVASPHRKEQKDAINMLVEGVKSQLPCWKREDSYKQKVWLPGVSPRWDQEDQTSFL